MPIIKVDNLYKEYHQRKGREGLTGAFKDLFNRQFKTVKAVDGVSFSIEKGEIVGYIGPNGAGKSTTIKMLIGILVPSSGKIDVNGIEPYKHRELNAKRIGVVFGQRTQLWWDIPVSETLSLMRYIYDVPEQQYLENLKIFSDILGLDKFYHTPVRQLSLGQRMRADISCALLHNPDILYLDEPTIGLDVVVKERIREFIREVNKSRNTTIILATHDMSDIERLSSRVMVVNSGKIMYDGNLNTLKRRYGTEETIVADLLKNPELIKPGGQRRRVTVFFADIAGFTSIAEKFPPEETALMLHDVLNAVSEEVIRHRGVIDKYIGDCVMAFWGAPLDSPDAARNACRAALASLEALEQVNLNFKARGLGAISMRVGLHTGDAIVGNLGSDRLFDYTVVGDTVNLASRIEGLTKGIGRILVSQVTRDAVGDIYDWIDRGSHPVKGRDAPVQLFEPKPKAGM